MSDYENPEGPHVGDAGRQPPRPEIPDPQTPPGLGDIEGGPREHLAWKLDRATRILGGGLFEDPFRTHLGFHLDRINQSLLGNRTAILSLLGELDALLWHTIEVLAGVDSYSFGGMPLTRFLGGVTEVPRALFPEGARFEPGKTLVWDATGTLAVYREDAGPDIIVVETKSVSPPSANRSVLLGNADTFADLPQTVGQAIGKWGKTPMVDDYAHVVQDETHDNLWVAWFVVSVDISSKINPVFWGNPVPQNLGDFQARTGLGDAGSVLVGGAVPGTFGTSRPIDRLPTIGSENLITSGAVAELEFGDLQPMIDAVMSNLNMCPQSGRLGRRVSLMGLGGGAALTADWANTVTGVVFGETGILGVHTDTTFWSAELTWGRTTAPCAVRRTPAAGAGPGIEVHPLLAGAALGMAAAERATAVVTFMMASDETNEELLQFFNPGEGHYTTVVSSWVPPATAVAFAATGATSVISGMRWTRLGGGSGSRSMTPTGLQLNDMRMMLGANAATGTSETTASAHIAGMFDLRSPLLLEVDFSGASGQNFQVNVNNNTVNAANSVHGAASRVINQALSGSGTLRRVIDTTSWVSGRAALANATITLRAEAAMQLMITGVRVLGR